MSLDRVIEEALGCFEAFRRFGYPAKDIFFCVDAGRVIVLLRTAKANFALPAGYWDGSREELIAAWEAGAARWNDESNAEWCKEVWERSYVRNHAYNFSVAMAERGLYPRKEN